MSNAYRVLLICCLLITIQHSTEKSYQREATKDFLSEGEVKEEMYKARNTHLEKYNLNR